MSFDWVIITFLFSSGRNDNNEPKVFFLSTMESHYSIQAIVNRF